MSADKYTCIQDGDAEFQVKLDDSGKEGEDGWQGFKSIRLIVIATIGTEKLTSQVAGLYNSKSDDKKLYLTANQIGQFKTCTDLTCDRAPNFRGLVYASAGPSLVELSFTKDTRKAVFIPATKSIAAKIILAFYSEFLDPVEKVMEVTGSSESIRIVRPLTTYYLSCLKYITDFDPISVAQLDPTFELLLDDMAFLPSSAWTAYNKAKTSDRKVLSNVICFHAVYGAFCFCRPVSTKRDFKAWITKRYTSFMASLSQTAEANSYPRWLEGGMLLNGMSTERPKIKRVIFDVIKAEYKDAKAVQVQNHIKMLVDLSEMTTYSLIQQVILHGGAVVCLKPLPEQFKKYTEEKATLIAKLKADGYKESDISYIHLIYPGTTCFTAANYPDMIVAARAIEEQKHGGANTLKSYQGKTVNSTISESLIISFLTRQRTTSSIDTSDLSKQYLRELLGSGADAHIREAERIVEILNANCQ